MGRTKTYDRDDLIERSMHLFREHGYASTSTQMLVDALGVNRYSIYAEFDSKKNLFEAALARYHEKVIAPRFAPLHAPEASTADIVDLFDFYGAAAGGPVSGLGCLLCNTAVELGPRDPSDDEFTAQYLHHLATGFRHALRSTDQAGALRPGVDIEAEANFLTASVLGLFVMLRAAAPPETIATAAAAAQHHVEALGAGPT